MAKSYLEKKEFNFFFLVDITSLKDVRKGTAGRKLEGRNTAKDMEKCLLLVSSSCIAQTAFSYNL